MDMNIFTLIGQIVVLVIILLVALCFITTILGLYLLKKDKLIFPKLLLFTLNLTYTTIKNVSRLLQLDDLMVDRISIDLRNRLNKLEFENTKAEDVIIVLPHCLRDTTCPAVLGESGLECVKCGKCSIGIIKKISEQKNIDVYIVPGSSFIKNILKQRKFKAVIGVACPLDLNLAMTSLHDFTPQGVYLLTDGCINTTVDVEEVIDLINKTLPATNYSINDFKEE
ncbi:MAG: hypothetical protein BZ137_07625 [Methanosphaera sp. rholeuAM130]|nr:MAG: hypothetical protein BZ137_07625 [Methanosphaera sp. rholeuAM130]